jgi:deoxyribodipyrimidine photo-lyase
LVLFRRDLRVADNLALAAAARSGRPVLTAFVLDEGKAGVRPLGAASRWWLHHSLQALERSLAGLGIRLVLRRGQMERTVVGLVEASGAEAVFWNRRYEPGGIAADTAMERALGRRGLQAESFDGHLMHEPSRVTNRSGDFYKVYSPFWNALAAGPEPRDPIDAPKKLKGFSGSIASEGLAGLDLLPKGPDWAGGLRAGWTPGEEGAQARLAQFLSEALDGYARRRDLPGVVSATSQLSPHLAHGEVTLFQVFAAIKECHPTPETTSVVLFRRELGWREFLYHLLFHVPHLDEQNFDPAFDAFPWRRDAKALRAWQKGMTGYPIVDAGMRELRHTGYMHNRVRMVAASFLTKHLLLDWRQGEGWFWDELVDADPANNPGNWQWVAGSGADAAPYFRIFNPVLQGEKFDPGGAYVRRWLPELAKLPDRYVHKPWEAPTSVLAVAGLTLGETYPAPIVEHTRARQRALAAWRAIRGRP